jgi:hypothetical protein
VYKGIQDVHSTIDVAVPYLEALGAMHLAMDPAINRLERAVGVPDGTPLGIIMIPHRSGAQGLLNVAAADPALLRRVVLIGQHDSPFARNIPSQFFHWAWPVSGAPHGSARTKVATAVRDHSVLVGCHLVHHEVQRLPLL